MVTCRGHRPGKREYGGSLVVKAESKEKTRGRGLWWKWRLEMERANCAGLQNWRQDYSKSNGKEFSMKVIIRLAVAVTRLQ